MIIDLGSILTFYETVYFTSEKVDPDSQRACDTVYHLRAVQPALLYWQRTHDPDLTPLFSAWMDTWVEATAREERGKPEGIIPSAIHWPDGQVGGLGKDWWDPRNHDESTLYRWPSAMSMMTSTLLLTHHITGEEAYLGPITSVAAHRAAYRKHPVKDAEPGSAMWCARRMGFLSGTLGKYRLITGDTRFDDLLLKDANGYVQFRLTGDRKRADRSLKRTAEALRVNREAYTTEVRWTDRVFAFHSHYANRYADPDLARPSLDMLYCTVTGDFGDPLYFPLNAVRWKTRPQNIAALVTDTSTTHLNADLYHFGDTPRSMGADLHLLEFGTYIWTLTTGPDTVSSGLFTVQDQRPRIAFSLPPKKLCTLQIQRR